MIFYNKLFQKYRESKCMTLLQVGKKIGLSKQSVQKYEAGNVKPKPATVYRIAAVLGISVADISDLKPSKDFKKEEINPSDDFFKILLKYWPKLSIEQRGKLAAETVSMAEANQALSRSSSSV